MPDSFEIAQTFGKCFVLLIFLIPAGIAVAALIVRFL
jgi:hypothetical protein